MEEMFDDLLRFLFPDADEAYDMERGLEFLNNELAEMHPQPDISTDTCFVDKLVKVFPGYGREEWVLMHIEIQGNISGRQEFAGRMFRYFYRILDRYKRPVSAVAVFTGRDGKIIPSQFIDAYRKTRLLYEYYTLSVLNFTDDELDNNMNPFAQIVLAARMSLLEMNRQFIEAINSQYKNDNMGIDEFIRWEAQEDLKEMVVLNLVRESNLPLEKIASVVGETEEYVNEVMAYDKMTLAEKRAYRHL